MDKARRLYEPLPLITTIIYSTDWLVHSINLIPNCDNLHAHTHMHIRFPARLYHVRHSFCNMSWHLESYRVIKSLKHHLLHPKYINFTTCTNPILLNITVLILPTPISLEFLGVTSSLCFSNWTGEERKLAVVATTRLVMIFTSPWFVMFCFWRSGVDNGPLYKTEMCSVRDKPYSGRF